MTPDFWIYFTILLASSGYGIFHFRKMPAWLRAVTLICLLTFITEVVSRILAYTTRNSMPPYHAYVILCYLLISYAYTKLHAGNRFLRQYCIATACILIIFSIINSLTLQLPHTFPSHAILLNSTFTLVLTLTSLTQMLLSTGKGPLLAEAPFWFNAANLLLYTSSFFYWGFYNILIAAHLMPDMFENIVAVCTLLAYLFYGISIHLGYKAFANGIRS